MTTIANANKSSLITVDYLNVLNNELVSISTTQYGTAADDNLEVTDDDEASKKLEGNHVLLDGETDENVDGSAGKAHLIYNKETDGLFSNAEAMSSSVKIELTQVDKNLALAHQGIFDVESFVPTTVSSSGNYQIDALLSGYKWNGKTITYSFFKGGSYYGFETGVSEISDAIKQNIRLIIESYIEPFINVDFVEVADTETTYGQMRYMFSNEPGYAYAYYPLGSQFNDIGGDVHLNPFYANLPGGVGDKPGTEGFDVLLHETLHALGLKHPGNYDGVETPPFLPPGEDNTTNTVMSYRGSEYSAVTPMPYDIKALQYLYGAKSFNTGNTTYSFDTVYKYTDGSQTRGSIITPLKLTIWDSGGIDTLDFSRLADDDSGYRFDLNQGKILTSQSAYNKSAYGVDETLYYTTSYGTGIAYGVRIENAIGSSSNDEIIGNSSANVISGGNGQDYFRGGAGNDSLYGNGDNDRLEGEVGNDILNGGTGNDTMSGGTGNDTYMVDSTGDVVNEAASAGTDTVRSSISRTLGVNLENLILTGSNAINGTGNSLNNRMTGNSVVNTLRGGAGNDVLNGGGGNDRLVGDSGNDTLTGGDGRDRFYFYNKNERVDAITDFNFTDDTIYVSASGFGGGLTTGTISTAQFRLGSSAQDSSDRFIYNQNTGNLFFDADGTGQSAKILIAELDAGLAMTNRDIVVFA